MDANATASISESFFSSGSGTGLTVVVFLVVSFSITVGGVALDTSEVAGALTASRVVAFVDVCVKIQPDGFVVLTSVGFSLRVVKETMSVFAPLSWMGRSGVVELTAGRGVIA